MKKHKNDPAPMKIAGTQLTKSGTSRFDLRDPYTIAISVRWTTFFALLLLMELIINSVFATLYTLSPGSIANARDGSFLDAFFFSIETLATVGYGAMSPATLYGHIVSAVEIVCGLVFTALVTGIIFVRFSKPKPNILFAEKAVITRHNGKQTLMIRIANGRDSLLAGAVVKVAVLKWLVSDEGRSFRQAFELKLTRDTLPVFLLTWTLMHEIDETSPLHGIDLQKQTIGDVLLILTIEARDHSAGVDVFDFKYYDGDRILPGMTYQDAVRYDGTGGTHADLTRLSLVEPDVNNPRGMTEIVTSQGVA